MLLGLGSLTLLGKDDDDGHSNQSGGGNQNNGHTAFGDGIGSDVLGANRAGVDMCWFNPKGKTAPADLPITYTIAAPEELIPLVLGE